MPMSKGVTHDKRGKSHRLGAGGWHYHRKVCRKTIWGVGTAGDGGPEVRAAGGVGGFSAAVIWVFLEKVALAAFGKQT